MTEEEKGRDGAGARLRLCGPGSFEPWLLTSSCEFLHFSCYLLPNALEAEAVLEEKLMGREGG